MRAVHSLVPPTVALSMASKTVLLPIRTISRTCRQALVWCLVMRWLRQAIRIGLNIAKAEIAAK